jgi:ubiquinone biosynthesis protein UbiJ
VSLIDTNLLNTIASAFETAINTALAMDPLAQKHLKRMRDCTLAISISSPRKMLYVGVEAKNLEQDAVHTEETYCVKLLAPIESSDVQIKGSLLSFIKLASSSNKSILFKTRELQLSGDSVRIQQIQSFLSVIKVDWEGILASIVGDIPAHIIGSSVRQGLNFSLNLGQSLLRDAEEFIKYELRLFPNKAAAKKQFAAIDRLCEATEKLERRIKTRLNETRQINL